MQGNHGQDRSAEDVWNVATWKSDISSKVLYLRQCLTKHVTPATWKKTLETQQTYFLTVVRQCDGYDISEEDTDNVDVIVEIIDEFIFNSGKDLSALHELQLLEILCSHFQVQENDVVRCLEFGTMFNLTPGGELKEFRCRMLAKLLSMSVALEYSSVLECVGVWVQKHRYLLGNILDLIQAIVHDYCILVPTSLPALESLVRHSALLTSQFITAVTILYPMSKLRHDNQTLPKNSQIFPPQSLLTLVADWVTKEPGISLTSFPQNLLLLPNCRVSQTDPEIPPPSERLPVSPIPGLIRWSILGPVCYAVQYPKPAESQSRTIMLVFSQLQFGVLQTFLTAKKHMDEKGQDCEIEPGEVMEEELDYRSLVSVGDLKGICKELVELVKELPKEISADLKNDITNLAVDRLAQVIQVAETTGCLSGTKAEFAKRYPSLPKTRLLNLVLEAK